MLGTEAYEGAFVTISPQSPLPGHQNLLQRNEPFKGVVHTMFRFLHSADWQLGARFAQFGAEGELLRAQRLQTLRTALSLARDRTVDAFFVAGDLFEDNLVADTLVDETLRTFAEFPTVPVFLLPGNHDPASGPGAVWSRRQFRDGTLPPNVTVLREPAAIPLPGGHCLLASPLRQKSSTVDPSLCLRDLVRTQPADRIKIGLTHGALAIPGKHQPNDFPIDPAGATRAGLDYLGIGHWHNWQVYDSDRLVMPGTPEPDAFDQPNAGFVAYVEIDGPSASPRVTKLPVGGLQWASFEYEFGEFDAARATLAHHVSILGDGVASSVCRVRLKGPAAIGPRTQAHDWLRELFRSAFHYQVQDHTHPMLSPGEIAALEREHPILCQVLADLAQIEMLATGRLPDNLLAPVGMALNLAEAQTLAAEARLPLDTLGAEDFLSARQLLFANLRDLTAAA